MEYQTFQSYAKTETYNALRHEAVDRDITIRQLISYIVEEYIKKRKEELVGAEKSN